MGSASLGYDGRGNLTSSGTGTYTYSAENLLVSALGSVTLSYDPLQWLSQTAAATTTRFGYDGANLVAEHSSGNLLQRRYDHGPGADEPLVWYEGASTTNPRCLHADERGSIIAISNASGATVAINRYDENGVPASTNLGRFQYTGQQWIPETGLYYFKARFYSAALGRFMQSDPIGYGDGMNSYAYVHGDPINGRDPSGMFDGFDSGSTGSHTFFVSNRSLLLNGARTRTVYPGVVTPVPPPLTNSAEGSVRPRRGLLSAPAAAVGASAEVMVEAARDALNDRVYVTYSLTNESTGQQYFGRSSGYGTAQEIADARYGSHWILKLEGYGPPKVDQSLRGFFTGRPAIRGREQQLIDAAGGLALIASEIGSEQWPDAIFRHRSIMKRPTLHSESCIHTQGGAT